MRVCLNVFYDCSKIPGTGYFVKKGDYVLHSSGCVELHWHPERWFEMCLPLDVGARCQFPFDSVSHMCLAAGNIPGKDKTGRWGWKKD